MLKMMRMASLDDLDPLPVPGRKIEKPKPEDRTVSGDKPLGRPGLTVDEFGKMKYVPPPTEPQTVAPAKPCAKLKDREQAAFEVWLNETRPSGCVESVQYQWMQSVARAEFMEDRKLFEDERQREKVNRYADMYCRGVIAHAGAQAALYARQSHKKIHAGVRGNVTVHVSQDLDMCTEAGKRLWKEIEKEIVKCYPDYSQAEKRALGLRKVYKAKDGLQR